MKNKKERKLCLHLRGWRCCLAGFRLAEIDICSHKSYYSVRVQCMATCQGNSSYSNKNRRNIYSETIFTSGGEVSR